MLPRLHLARVVTCPDCKGEGHLAASPSEWESWFRAYMAAQAHHQDVLAAYQAGDASRAELDAAVAALTDVVTTPSAELGDGSADRPAAPGFATGPGGVCEACRGYGVQPRQRRIVGRRAA